MAEWVPTAGASGGRTVTIRAGRGRPNLAALRELWAFREVLSAFVARRVRVRYKQALFGAGWVVLQPLAMAAIFGFFFGKLAHLPSDGAPYFVFVLSGLVIWTYFSHAFLTSTESLVAEAGVIRKVFFPREISPLSAVIAGLVDLGVALIIISVIVVVATGHAPTLVWLMLPLPLLLIVLIAAAAGLFFSSLNVYYRDVSNAMPFILQLGFFLSSVIYPITIIPAHFRPMFEIVNPVTAAIESVRSIMLLRTVPDMTVLGLAFVWTLMLLAIGYSVFKLLERRFADHV